MHFCMHFGLVCSAGSNHSQHKQTRNLTAGNWHFACLHAALQRKTEQSGRAASPQLLQSVHLFIASCWNFPAPRWGIRESISSHPSSRSFCYSSTWGETSLQQSSWKPPPTCALWTRSHPKHLCPKPGSLEDVCMNWHPATSSLPALTVLIRRLLENAVPPKDCSCWRILMLPKGCCSKLLIVCKTQPLEEWSASLSRELMIICS